MADLMDKGECNLSHIHSVYDTDTHFKIDAVTRAVKNTPETKVMIVQHDHNSERFTFEIPRYVDGHDMSTCNVVQVHYINTDATGKGVYNKGIYEVDDLQISPDDDNVVICSWLISGNATQYVGKLSFVIRFACTTGGVVDYAWNTATHSNVHISSGINNGNEIAEEYVDILEQWHEELFNGNGGSSGGSNSGVYILAEGETVDDAPDTADVVIDPNGETDFDGNAESDVLCVTVQGNTADKTVSEIYEAYQAGKSVVCHVRDLDGNFATNLVVCSSDIACFSASVGDVVLAVTLTENGVQMEFTDILTENELPEISGGGISVTGASVDQTIKISAVDENGVPTAWEPVDFPSGGSGGKNVKSVTLSEEVDAVALTLPYDKLPVLAMYYCDIQGSDTVTETNYTSNCLEFVNPTVDFARNMKILPTVAQKESASRIGRFIVYMHLEENGALYSYRYRNTTDGDVSLASGMWHVPLAAENGELTLRFRLWGNAKFGVGSVFKMAVIR